MDDKARGELPWRIYVSMRVYHRGWRKVINCKGMTLRVEGFTPPEVYYWMLRGLGLQAKQAHNERRKVEAIWKEALNGPPPTGPRGNPTGAVGSGIRLQHRAIQGRRRVARSPKARDRSE